MEQWCDARNSDLKQERGEYLEQTRNHETIMPRVLDAFGLGAETETPGRGIVRTKAETLVGAMETALRSHPAAAQLGAAECVEAESKDRAPLPHHGLGTGAVARIAWAAGRAPAPEEQRHPKSAIGADTAKQAREDLPSKRADPRSVEPSAYLAGRW